jgi:uncharacterized C2H2 Zn-finger protein
MEPFIRSLDGERLVFCPLCGEWFGASDFLAGVFRGDDKAEFLANLVTHMRHEHVVYYNNSVNYVSHNHNYDHFKEQVNRMKRRLIREARGFLVQHGFSSKDFCKLQSTDEVTRVLARKMLGL